MERDRSTGASLLMMAVGSVSFVVDSFLPITYVGTAYLRPWVDFDQPGLVWSGYLSIVVAQVVLVCCAALLIAGSSGRRRIGAGILLTIGVLMIVRGIGSVLISRGYSYPGVDLAGV